jgi:CubicO group peptidase (beta-lactamase class C family)
MVRVVCVLSVLAGPAGFTVMPPPSEATDWKQWLDGQAAGFSGVALIARGDNIEVEAAYGSADPAGTRRNTRDTRFNLGSINKTFTAVAIAQLIEQGRLTLDDTLAKHLPDYPNQVAAARITIRDLLTHRSGVAQFMRADFGDISVAAMVKTVGAQPQAFDPGARQEYSNGGYIVLGRVIEVVSGKTYSAYISDHIYRPAGMTASGFSRKGDRDDNVALPVTSAGGRGMGPGPGLATPPAGPRSGNPAGGGYSTAADLFRFARALRAGRLLDQRMTEYVLNDTFAEQPQWGFALREQTIGSHRFIGNGGGAPAVNAEFRFEPSGVHTVVVLANSSPPAATALLTAVQNRIAGESPAPAAPAQSTAAVPERTPRTPLRAAVDALHAEMMAAFREEPASVARHYTADARILGGGRRFSGTDEILRYWSQVPAGATWELDIVDVGGSAEEPWVLGRFTLSRPGGPGMAVEYLAILRRDASGTLKYHIDMFTAAAR